MFTYHYVMHDFSLRSSDYFTSYSFLISRAFVHIFKNEAIACMLVSLAEYELPRVKLCQFYINVIGCIFKN